LSNNLSRKIWPIFLVKSLIHFLSQISNSKTLPKKSESNSFNLILINKI
jgi:hypothetical protein